MSSACRSHPPCVQTVEGMRLGGKACVIYAMERGVLIKFLVTKQIVKLAATSSVTNVAIRRL